MVCVFRPNRKLEAGGAIETSHPEHKRLKVPYKHTNVDYFELFKIGIPAYLDDRWNWPL